MSIYVLIAYVEEVKEKETFEGLKKWKVKNWKE